MSTGNFFLPPILEGLEPIIQKRTPSVINHPKRRYSPRVVDAARRQMTKDASMLPEFGWKSELGWDASKALPLIELVWLYGEGAKKERGGIKSSLHPCLSLPPSSLPLHKGIVAKLQW